MIARVRKGMWVSINHPKEGLIDVSQEEILFVFKKLPFMISNEDHIREHYSIANAGKAWWYLCMYRGEIFFFDYFERDFGRNFEAL